MALRPRKILKNLLLALVILTALTEGFGRWVMGLCNVPLYQPDEQVEYVLQPNQDCRIMGSQIFVNRYSMRSDDFEPAKKPGEIRILVVGDSILYGGNLVDQKQLATSILQTQLRKLTGHDDLLVCNVATGGWGPGNELAYFEKYGTFDHDFSVIVSSSDDIDDVPVFPPQVGQSPDFPVTKPRSSIYLLVTRFIPRAFDIRHNSATPPPAPSPEHADPRVLKSTAELVRKLHAGGRPVYYFIHRRINELGQPPQAAMKEMIDVAQHEGAIIVDMNDVVLPARQRGIRAYRDEIHPTPEGEELLGYKMIDELLPLIKARLASPATTQPAAH